MQTVTDFTTLRRRQLLLTLGAGTWACGMASHASVVLPLSSSPSAFMATWRCADGTYAAGILAPAVRGWVVIRQERVPTRAHGICHLPGGGAVVVARRPGDWLMQWHPRTAVKRMVWAEPDRRFNGHALVSHDGAHVFTTETNLDDGMGLVGVRRLDTLEKVGEWPTHGRDPHDLEWAPSPAVGQFSLMVANGGVESRPETGRQKINAAGMDSSLVRLDLQQSGKCTGQWRLKDAQLSMRHLVLRQTAGRSSSPMLGIALQSEHDDQALRLAAPVLAIWHSDTLTLAEQPISFDGYGGDICAIPSGFAVSSPKAGKFGLWRTDGTWQHGHELPQACALSFGHEAVWCASGREVVCVPSESAQVVAEKACMPEGVQVDNHWEQCAPSVLSHF